MYEVWKWTTDEIEEYNEYAGDDAFYISIERDQYHGIVDYGELVLKTDDKQKAEIAASDVFNNYSFGSGEVSIYDTKEHYWFN